MKFSQFLNEAKDTVKYVGNKAVYSSNLNDIWVVEESVEFDSNSISFSITPVLKEGEDKDINEIIFATVEASFKVDRHHEPQTYDHPGVDEFEIDAGKAKITDVNVKFDKEDVETYPGIEAAAERFKKLLDNKETIAKLVSKRLDDVLNEFEDHIEKKERDSH